MEFPRNFLSNLIIVHIFLPKVNEMESNSADRVNEVLDSNCSSAASSSIYFEMTLIILILAFRAKDCTHRRPYGEFIIDGSMLKAESGNSFTVLSPRK